MKKLAKIGMIIFTSLSLNPTYLNGKESSGGNRIIAKVNEQIITLKDLEDYEADIACKRNTLPHSYGIRTTYNVATLLIIFSFFWSLIVAYILVSQGGLRFTFFLSLTTVSMFYLYKKNISKAQGWMKVALLGHLLIDMLYWNTNYYV